jgi:phosphoglycolate phosphatase-like HAD superfamily hydrolase
VDAPVVGFDLDMTLVDSAAGICATFAAAVAAVPGGASARSAPDDIWPWIGLPLQDTAAALAPLADPDEVARAYRARYASTGVPLTTVMPGALDALAAVRRHGGRILVVSAKALAGVHEVLTAVGLDHGDLAPDVVVGDLFAGRKGGALRAAGAHVYVGDHTGDVAAARAGGCAAVAVATGPVPAAELAAAGADVVLPGLSGFADWLDRFVAAPAPDVATP